MQQSELVPCLLGAASQFRQVKSEIDAFDPIFVEVDLAPRKWWHIRVTQCGKNFFTWNQIWKFETFPFTLNWREISYGESEMLKATILMISDALNFDFCHLLTFKNIRSVTNIKIQSLQRYQKQGSLFSEFEFLIICVHFWRSKWQKSKFVAPEIAKVAVFWYFWITIINFT